MQIIIIITKKQKIFFSHDFWIPRFCSRPEFLKIFSIPSYLFSNKLEAHFSEIYTHNIRSGIFSEFLFLRLAYRDRRLEFGF